MKKRTIHLIVEDVTDKDVVKALLKAKGSSIDIQHLGGGGIDKLAQLLEALILIAIKKRKKGDCIAVLHDADETTNQKQKAQKIIKDICKKYSQDVKLMVAVDEIESWLLADESLCQWLGIKATNNDHLKKPSDKLNSAVNKKAGKKYYSIREKVLQHLNGTGDKYSPSMKEAVAALIEADCMKG